MAERWTVSRLLDSMRQFFESKGVDSPRLDAEVLLSHVLGKTRIYLYTHYDQPITDAERDAVRALSKRRALHEPIAYIVGSKEFYGTSIIVTPDVLIPRPETEQLVDIACAFFREHEKEDKRFRVLDIGTGSGAIAIALAQQEPRASIVAIDISDKAVEVARNNVTRHGLESQVEIVHADAVSFLASAQGRQQPEFDVIVSNPPYIGLDEKPALARSVVSFEPHQALFSGDTGSDVIEQVMRVAETLLAHDGLFAMEIAPRHVDALMQRQVFGRSVHILDDLAGHPRIVVSRP